MARRLTINNTRTQAHYDQPPTSHTRVVHIHTRTGIYRHASVSVDPEHWQCPQTNGHIFICGCWLYNVKYAVTGQRYICWCVLIVARRFTLGDLM